MSEALAGGCQCGAVRYTAVTTAKFRPYACHCTLCQAQTGSAFSQHVLMIAGDLKVEGVLIEGRRTKDDGNVLSIFACPICFSRIYSENSGRPGLITLRCGTLNDRTDFAPDFHLWTHSKQPWVVIPEGARAFDSQVESAEDWTALMTGQLQ